MKGVQQCVFCDLPADTVEHVVPKWLQSHFHLFHQQLLLSNGTTIRYRQATVPACLRCNRDRLGPLEQRVQNDCASERDYFLWALKITCGLSYRDSTLLLDRSNPEAGPVVAAEAFAATATLFRHALRSLDSPNFRFSPDPFGSVIFVPSATTDFALIDVPGPFRALAVALPNRGHLIVLAGDRGVLARAYRRKRHLSESLERSLPEIDTQLQLAVKVFGLLILRSHLAIPQLIRLEDEAILSAPIPRRVPTIDQSLDLYREIAQKLNLPEYLAVEAYSKYSKTYSAGAHFRWR
jgi:hypothetical protein